MSNLNNNTAQLEALLQKVNELPEAGGGADTSDASATSDEIFAGETAYGAEGKITGTFTIQDELTEQNDLISQISTLVAQKANPQGGTEDLDTELTAQESLISQLSSILDNKASGGGSVETCSGKLTAHPNGLGELGNQYTLTYTNGTLNVTTEQASRDAVEHEFTAVKNTIVFISGGLCYATSGCTQLGGAMGEYAYLITDNNFVLTNDA